MVSLFWNSAMIRGRDEVYAAAMPLRATKRPPQLLMSAAYSLNFWDFQHFMVIIKPSSPSQAEADAVEIAREFNKEWETNLRIGLHDCHDYTNTLVWQLTGEKDVLKRLRNIGS
ncbi:hypothetical protein GmHk_14G039746 [Glycine max]|nr:hypothetical protein GmHk_14G039746 [Glycine max]